MAVTNEGPLRYLLKDTVILVSTTSSILVCNWEMDPSKVYGYIKVRAQTSSHTAVTSEGQLRKLSKDRVILVSYTNFILVSNCYLVRGWFKLITLLNQDQISSHVAVTNEGHLRNLLKDTVILVSTTSFILVSNWGMHPSKVYGYIKGRAQTSSHTAVTSEGQLRNLGKDRVILVLRS